MLELLECMDLQSTIVRTYIQCDMHDGGEGGLHPPFLDMRALGSCEGIPKGGREEGLVSA